MSILQNGSRRTRNISNFILLVSSNFGRRGFHHLRLNDHQRISRGRVSLPAVDAQRLGGRARARLIEDFRDSQFNGHFVHIIQEIRKPEGERDTSGWTTRGLKSPKRFDRIEKELEGKEYFAGAFSLADIAFMPNIDLLDRFGSLSIRNIKTPLPGSNA